MENLKKPHKNRRVNVGPRTMPDSKAMDGRPRLLRGTTT